MLLRFEMANVGVLVFDIAGTSLTARKAQGTSVLRESNEHGKRAMGVHQEPGRSCRLHGGSVEGVA